MLEEIKLYVLIFFIYATAGWIMESTMISIQNKKFVNRGFLIGPVCPIYGYGVVLVSILLKKYQDDIIVFIYNNKVVGIYKTYDKDQTKMKPYKIFNN